MKRCNQRYAACIGAVLYTLGVATPVWAEDIEIFFTPDQAVVPANVLLILDASDSMDELIPDRSPPQTRLEGLKEALTEILSAEYQGLKIGLQDFAGNDNVGIDWPITNINEDAHNTDPDIAEDAYTVGTILQNIISFITTRNLTPTVTALLEAAYYYRGDLVLEGKKPPPYWDATRDPPRYIIRDHDASHAATYEEGAYVEVEQTRTRACTTGSTSSQCNPPTARLIEGSCEIESSTSRTTRSSPDPGIPFCEEDLGLTIVTEERCRVYAPRECAEWDLTGSECIRYEPRVCLDTELRPTTSQTVPETCYFQDDRLWQVTTTSRERCQYEYDVTVLQLEGTPRYISPIEYSCQPNYIVLLSDGAPSSNIQKGRVDDLIRTEDPTYTNSDACDDLTSFGLDDHGKCGPDLVRFLHEYDQSDLEGDQTIVTYTIGFNLEGVPQAQDYLRRLAEVGGGRYFDASQPDELVRVFQAIIEEIKSENNRFASPAITTDRSNPLVNRPEVYLTIFRPSDAPRWVGNVKGYKVKALTDPPSCKDGCFVDQDESPAIGLDGQFKDTARSFWSVSADGNAVDKGGAASKQTTTRNTYTYTGTESGVDPGRTGLPGSSIALATDAHRLRETNTLITNAMLGRADTETDPALEDLLKWIHGIDVRDEDNDSSTTDARQQMGDPLHVTPVVVLYSPSKLVLYVTTNEGYLHAIDVTENGTTGGSELFAFMPRELLPNIEKQFLNSTGDPKVYGLDGRISGWRKEDPDDGNTIIDGDDRVYLYFGMRRGGTSYYAMDVTDTTAPKLMWVIRAGSPGFKRLGQTWGRMILTRIEDRDGNPRMVLVVPGGYDTRQDDKEVRSFDYVGNAVYIIDAETGERLWAAAGPNGLETFYEEVITELEDVIIPNAEADLLAAQTERTRFLAEDLADPPDLTPAEQTELDLRDQEIVDAQQALDEANSQLTQAQADLLAAQTEDDTHDLELASLKNSVPSDISIIDADNNGIADRLYFGTTGGRVFRIDLGGGNAFIDSNENGDFTDDDLDHSSGYLLADLGGSDAANNRRFFYPPSVSKVQENGLLYLTVAIGSGYRAHPLDGDIQDWFFVIKDAIGLPSSTPSALGLSDLVDLTDNLLVEGTEEEQAAVEASLGSSDGWRIQLAAREKVLAEALTLQNKVFFTTYKPAFNPETDDICDILASGGPETRFYTLNLFNALPGGDQAAVGEGEDPLAASNRSRETYSKVPPPPPLVIYDPPADDSTSYTAKVLDVSDCEGEECADKPFVPQKFDLPLKLISWEDLITE